MKGTHAKSEVLKVNRPTARELTHRTATHSPSHHPVRGSRVPVDARAPSPHSIRPTTHGSRGPTHVSPRRIVRSGGPEETECGAPVPKPLSRWRVPYTDTFCGIPGLTVENLFGSRSLNVNRTIRHVCSPCPLASLSYIILRIPVKRKGNEELMNR